MSRYETYLRKIAGEDVDISNMPEPSDRYEYYLKQIAENGGGQIDPEDIAEIVTDWLDDHVDPETGYVIDNTLLVEGAAADAKKVGDEVADLKSAINKLDGSLTRITEGNLFDSDDATTGKRIDPAGDAINATGYYISDYIPVTAGMKYYKNSPTEDSYHRVAYYTKNKNLATSGLSTDNLTTAPSNAAFARICGATSEMSTAVFQLVSATDNVARANINTAETYAGVIAHDVPTPSSGTTDLFTISDVPAGSEIYYSISVGTGTAVGYNVYIELQDSGGNRLAIYGKTLGAQTASTYSGFFVVPNNMAKAVLRGTCVGSYLEYVRVNGVVGYQNTALAQSPAFVGSPVTIFENDDESAITDVDAGLLNTVSVVKISDEMYYMYYEAFGTSGGTDATMKLCFAYSTDGENFTKEIPQGITPPYANSNVLLPSGTTHGHSVVKVPDNDFPFRMVATTFITGANYVVAIWKSADGVHWTKIRNLTSGGNDSPVSCVVRGNALKIFYRENVENIREISVMITDLDGNLYNSYRSCHIGTATATKQYYQASASPLDDKREILLPTLYNSNNYKQTVGCVILDGGRYTEVPLDASIVVTSDVKSIYFASGIVNIGLKTYAFYETRDSDHNSFTLGTTKSAINRIEIKVQ